MIAVLSHATARKALPYAVLTVVVIRLAVQIAVPQPVVSDAIAYFAMADTLAGGETMRDNFGQVAFYSPGYPVVLGLGFMMAGASLTTALAINLILAAITAALIAVLTMRLTHDARPALLAVAGYGVWLPSLLSAATIAKENLSIPLMLGFAIATLDVANGKRPIGAAIVAGLCFAAGLLAGASSLFVVAALAIALNIVVQRHGASRAVLPATAFALVVVAVISPWLMHTNREFGHPVLTTNSGFNQYLGNNPAANGGFVSIADTPIGPRWQAMRAALGEDGSATALGGEAQRYIAANQMRAATLAGIKLARFWAPNVPDAADQAKGVMAAVRWIDVAQHILILVLGLAGLWRLRGSAGFDVMAAIFLSFWAIHMFTYVMVRYREPVMPIMIALAATALWSFRPAKPAMP